MLAIVAVLLRLSVTSAGPARSLGSVIASRTVKIPRAIRAPFRNNEMMTARGFGKRSQQMIKFKDGESSFSAPFLFTPLQHFRFNDFYFRQFFETRLRSTMAY